MPEMLPPVVATLIADIREYSTKMDEAQGKMDKFGKSTDTAGEKFSKFASRASTAIIATGAAVAAYGIDRALKYEESLNAIQNQANVTAGELEYLKGKILDVSNQTAISSDQISQAYLQAEKAGLHYKKATDLVTAAAKASAITGGNVIDTTKTLIGIQALGIAKGKDSAQIADMIVKANKAHVGSLDTLIGMLTGKVGAALSAYHVNLGDALAITDTLSKAGYNNTRAIATMFQAMGKLEDPTKSNVKALAQMGINADTLAAKLRQPNGLLSSLAYLQSVAKETGTPIQTLLQKVYGSSGGVVANILLNNLGQIKATSQALSGATGAGLDTAFGVTQGQLGFKMKQLKTQFQNTMTGVGMSLLPAATDLANWSENTAKYFQKHPLAQKIFTDASLTLLGTAIATKIGMGMKQAMALIAVDGMATRFAAIAGPLLGVALGAALGSYLSGQSFRSIWDYLTGKIHPQFVPGANTLYYQQGVSLGLKGDALRRFMLMQGRTGGIDFWDQYSHGPRGAMLNPYYNAAAAAAFRKGYYGSIGAVGGYSNPNGKSRVTVVVK